MDKKEGEVMSMIQTGIELNDQFTSVMYGIINSTYEAVYAAGDMQQAMNASVDPSGFETATDEVNQMTSAVEELNAALQEAQANIVTPTVDTGSQTIINADVNPILPTPLVENPEPIRPEIQPNAPPEPVVIPVQWESYEGLDVFTETGIERFEQEIASVNAMLEQLSSTQDRITQQANESQILSPQAIYDIQNVENRVQSLRGMIEQVENNPLNVGTDSANSQLERLRGQLDYTLQLQDNLNTAMQGMNIGNINAAYLQLSETVSNTERLVRDSFSNIPPVEIPIQWQTDNLDVFTGTGIDRFRQEVQSTNTLLAQLSSTQDSIARQAYNMNIFPPEAFQNLNSLAVRIDMVRDRIQQIENNSVNIGTDTANAELERLRSQLNQALQAQNDLNDAMQNMDVSAANDAYLRLSSTVSSTERYIRDNVDEQGRFNQEINAGTTQANDLMKTIKGAVTAYVSIQTAGKALNISDELVQTTSRLNMMNDGLQSTDELVYMVYAAAEDARGSFSDMAAVVARFGNNARDAFGSSEEVVAFANLVQKQMTIAGASTTEASNAMLQLSQALGSGVLRGDELNSIFEQAPNLIQNIADYLEVPIGQIREMASDGELSADIVKAAIVGAADDINAKFEQMPMTWGQIWQSMQNTAIMAFQPVLQRLNDIANSEAFQNFVSGAIQGMAVLANIVLNIFELIGTVAGFIADNWSIISPIIYGVIAALALYGTYLAITKAAELIGTAIKIAMCVASYAHAAATRTAVAATTAETAAQLGLNTAFLSCPLVWIILAIIALIAVIFAVCNAIAKMTGVASSGFGVITGGVNVVIQFFKNLGLMVANIALGIGSAIGALCDNMMTAFNNAICSVQSWFYGLLATACEVVAGICAELNKLPFVEFDYSGITSAAADFAAKSAEAAGNKGEYTSVADAFNKGMSTFDTFQDGWVSDAFDAGAAWGDGIADKVSNFSLSDLFGSTDIPNPDDYASSFSGAMDNSALGSGVDDIAGNTGDIKDSITATEEDLKYLRDIAEQESVNRYTVAEVYIDQSGMQNTVKNGDDLDGFMSGLTDSVNEAVDSITEGVHK